MKSLFRCATLSVGLLASTLANAQSYTGYPSFSKAEALQLTQNMSPKARSELAKREAYAAYEEALRACKSMERSERKACNAQAKEYLRNDLSYAKNILTEDTSAGSSGSGASGTGSPDAESAGSSGSSGSMSSAESTATVRVPVVVVMSPKEQYNLAVREAHAAYAEAVRVCKTHARNDRAECMKEARFNLRSDLAYAKNQLKEGGQSAGGGNNAGMSGTGN